VVPLASKPEHRLYNDSNLADSIIYEFVVDEANYDLGSGKPEKIKNQDNPE